MRSTKQVRFRGVSNPTFPAGALVRDGLHGLPAFPSPLARRGSRAELIAAVSALEPSLRRLELGSALRAAVRLAASAGMVRAEVHLLSDLQASAFGAP